MFSQENLVEYSFIEINDKKPYPFELFSDNSYEFGVLKIKMNELPVTSEPISILFMVDYSASMSDVCRDGRTKITHLKHTLCRIIEEINDKNVNVNISVVAFDHRIEEIFDFVRVTKDNLRELVEKRENIRTQGSTNIENALKEVKKRIDTQKRKCYNVFMTDGEVTEGEKEPLVLSTILENSVQNLFIGFGDSHDSHLLRYLSRTSETNDYRFIDKLENSGLVYGEILHSILYCVIENPKISIDFGEVYDWNNDKWINEMYIPNLVSGTEKVFHIRTRTPHDICGHLWKNILKNHDYSENRFVAYIEKLPSLTNSESGMEEVVDLTPYMYRQRTQELLYKVVEIKEKEYVNESQSRDLYDYIRNVNFKKKDIQNMENKKDIEKQKNEVKKIMREFTKQLLEYKEQNQDGEHGSMLKLLCDDMYVAFKSMDSERGVMYTASRQSSQGRQQVYTASQDVDDIIDTRIDMLNNVFNKPMKIRRQKTQTDSHSFESISDDDDNDQLFKDYVVNDNIDSTPYSTPAMLKIMRDVSIPFRTSEFSSFEEKKDE